MKTEWKICLPFYKIAYSVFFTAILSVIRGVSYTFEIGIALEPPMALLAVVLCADTYVQEITSRRSEVERLFPLKNRMISLYRRMGIQELYLLILAIVGYGLFYVVQKPVSYSGMESGVGSEAQQLLVYAGAIVITLIFWGSFSLVLSCLLRNMWMAVGGCLILWIITNSMFAERMFGYWNLFSYTQRNVEDGGDFSWICGKILCLACSIAMAAVLPKIIKKRG